MSRRLRSCHEGDSFVSSVEIRLAKNNTRAQNKADVERALLFVKSSSEYPIGYEIIVKIIEFNSLASSQDGNGELGIAL